MSGRYPGYCAVFEVHTEIREAADDLNMSPFRRQAQEIVVQPFKYEAQTALFKDPVRTAQ